MSFENGTLVKWNDERGFGFIKPDTENVQVFVHIKTFGPISRRPLVGDQVYFDSTIGEQGKRKATFARITESSNEASSAPRRTHAPASRPRTTRRLAPSGWSPTSQPRSGPLGFRRRMKSYALVLLIPFVGITWIASTCSSPTSNYPSQLSIPDQLPEQSSTTIPVSTGSSFQCQGKEHCSQMSSKEEAQFYLDHCPNVKVDGDHDGIPCEQQFGQ